MSIDNRADANLSVYLVDYGAPGSNTRPFVVTRGWMDPQNRTGWSHTVAVQQGVMYDYRWNLQPKDYVFAAGHRIGVVVFSSDQEYTLLPLGGTQLTVQPGASRLTVPVVGGREALGF
jgi:X-Pro dipeptidyl-peptidase